MFKFSIISKGCLLILVVEAYKVIFTIILTLTPVKVVKMQCKQKVIWSVSEYACLGTMFS